MITIHGNIVSPFVRKTHAYCIEKGIDFESADLAPIPKSEELLSKNPLGKIPILQLEDGDFLPDSSIICGYLERMHPDPALLPADPKACAQALFFEEWADTKIVEATSPFLFERVIKRRFFDQEPDEERLAGVVSNELPPAFDALEEKLPGSGPLVGGRFGLADCALGAQLQNLALGGFEIDASRWPRLRAYSDSVLGRPSFKQIAASLSE